MSRRSISTTLLTIVVGSVLVLVQCDSMPAQAPQSTATPAQAVAPSQPGAAAKPATPAPWQGSQLSHLSRRAEMYYEDAWGVGELRVKVA